VVYPASVPSKRVPEDTIAVFTLGLFDLESPANTLTLTVTSTNHALLPPVPPYVTYTFDGTGTNMLISCLPVTNIFGKTVLTFTISDGTNTTSRTTTLQVDPVNDPPSFTIISNVINWTGTAGPMKARKRRIGGLSTPIQLCSYLSRISTTPPKPLASNQRPE
jgi:hypothetical protein